MIPRYTRPEMAAIWEAQTRFKIWFEIEAHAADALAEIGVIPKEAARAVWAKARDAIFNVERIDEIALAYAPRLGLPAGVCAKYLRDLRYNLDDADLAGLRTFLGFALPEFHWESIERL